MYKDFHELDVWQEGYRLLMNIYDTSESFPTEEKYSLISQIRRSANSFIANIAESHGRYSYQDKIRVLYIARGEITETRSHLAVAFGRKYIDSGQFKTLNEDYKQLAKNLNIFINSLRKKKTIKINLLIFQSFSLLYIMFRTLIYQFHNPPICTFIFMIIS